MNLRIDTKLYIFTGLILGIFAFVFFTTSCGYSTPDERRATIIDAGFEIIFQMEPEQIGCRDTFIVSTIENEIMIITVDACGEIQKKRLLQRFRKQSEM